MNKTAEDYKKEMAKKSIYLIPLWLIGLFGMFIPFGYLDWFWALPLAFIAFILMATTGSIMKDMSNKFEELK
jgi:4-hydroxybenzoate polyprenyltransferase